MRRIKTTKTATITGTWFASGAGSILAATKKKWKTLNSHDKKNQSEKLINWKLYQMCCFF